MMETFFLTQDMEVSAIVLANTVWPTATWYVLFAILYVSLGWSLLSILNFCFLTREAVSFSRACDAFSWISMLQKVL